MKMDESIEKYLKNIHKIFYFENRGIKQRFYK